MPNDPIEPTVPATVRPVGLQPLPAAFATTRDALHQLACFVMSPYRKARTGRIGLRATGDGFGTPLFDDGSRLVVRGDALVVEPGSSHRITTLRNMAAVLHVDLLANPGIGEDVPPLFPDMPLHVDVAASLALGGWYAFGQATLDALALRYGTAVREAQLWPEHFDLASEIHVEAHRAVNVGVSPGDAFSAEPYVYIGPHSMESLANDPFWNAPFGAILGHATLLAAHDAPARVLEFVEQGIGRLREE